MGKSPLFYVTIWMAASLLTLVLIFLLLVASPLVIAFSTMLIFLIAGLITPLSSSKDVADIDKLAIQNVDWKLVITKVMADMPLTISGGVLSAIALLVVNAVSPLGLENKIVVAIAILGTSFIWPFCYRGAEAASIKYAETLK